MGEDPVELPMAVYITDNVMYTSFPQWSIDDGDFVRPKRDVVSNEFSISMVLYSSPTNNPDQRVFYYPGVATGFRSEICFRGGRSERLRC